MQNSTTTTGGISVLGLLGVVFVTLKLCGVISWSWWYVLMPFYIVPAFCIGCLIIYMAGSLIHTYYTNKKNEKVN